MQKREAERSREKQREVEVERRYEKIVMPRCCKMQRPAPFRTARDARKT